MDCQLKVREELLLQVKEFKYCHGVSRDMDTILVCCAEEKFDPEGEALN